MSRSGPGRSPIRVVLDCDPGNGVPATDVDDGLALGLALASPAIELEAVTVVNGNTDRDTGYAVARSMLAAVGAEVSVHAGAAAALQEPGGVWRRRREAKLADPRVADWWAGVPAPAPHDVGHDFTGPAEIARLVAEHPGEITLVAVGPLTNVAQAMQLHPGLARDVARIVVMGGAFDVPGYLQELNFAVDPEAAHTVLTSGAAVTLVPLDVTATTTLLAADLDRLATAGTPLADYLVTTSRPWITYCEAVRGRPGCRLHDPLAMALLIQPDLVRTERWSVDVSLTGLTRGRPIRWRADELRLAAGLDLPELAPVDVVVEVDAPRLTEHLVDVLGAPVPSPLARPGPA